MCQKISKLTFYFCLSMVVFYDNLSYNIVENIWNFKN
jgi:hypothetical protein